MLNSSLFRRPVSTLSLLAVLGLASLPAGSAHASPRHDAVTAAAQLGRAFSRVAGKASPSVVHIKVETAVQRGGGMGQFFGQQAPESFAQGGGSGVIISANGGVLTNNHVVENARRIEVQLSDGRRFPAKVVGTDPASDLAVLDIEAKGLPAARFADSDAAEVGEWVVAIGSPFGLKHTVTAGVLSAKGRGGLGGNEIQDYLQTDASINPGNSGGPLVNLSGEVLGINTMIIGRASGIGFAIPSNLARRVAEQLRKTGQVKRAWIGVSYQELTPELASQFGAKLYRGALINQVVPGGPADQAHMQPGDIVTTLDGREVTEGRDLLRSVLRHPVGTQVEVTVLRRGQNKKLKLTMGERPSDPLRRTEAAPRRRGSKKAQTTTGMALARLTPSLARQLRYAGPGGVVVAEVRPGSPADHAGLVRGDIIEEINHRPVKEPRSAGKALGDSGGALLTLSRHGGKFFTVIDD